MMKAKRIIDACYKASAIPEYAGNPFIEALPDILSQEAVVEKFTHIQTVQENDCLLPLEVKKHYLARILDFFILANRHFDLQDKISLMIRKGYVNRDPIKGGYTDIIVKSYQSRQKGESVSEPVLFNEHTVPLSSSLIGTSGVGKTTALSRILAGYPQGIRHKEQGMLQVVWLKLDCPKDGSLVGLCKEFFRELDDKFGSRYIEKYCLTRKTADDLLLDMQQVSAIHAIGLLVIDEIQHLDASKTGGREVMFNFFVNLENTLGIPVLTVGTLKAMKLFKTDFRQARRAGQLGTMEWLQHEKDSDDWNYLLEEVWNFQLTRTHTPLTDELKVVVYECTQGITAVLTSLFMLVQHRAMELEAFQSEEGEAVVLTPDLIRQVFDDSFQMMRPMLEALRINDVDALAKYDDIRPPVEVAQVNAQTLREAAKPAIADPKSGSQDQNNIKLLSSMFGISEAVIELVWMDIKASNSELNSGQISQLVVKDERLQLSTLKGDLKKDLNRTQSSTKSTKKESGHHRQNSQSAKKKKVSLSNEDFLAQAEQNGFVGMPEVLKE
jgi:hypothetical protein